MKNKKVVSGVILSRSRGQKQEIRSALTWLDIKIDEFIARCDADKKYSNSNRALIEFSEILGVLKFLYMSEVISVEEYRLIVRNVTGEDISKEEVKKL